MLRVLQVSLAVYCLLVFVSGADWTILNPPSTWQRWEVAQLYGRNDMATGRPNLFKMAEDVFLYPVHVIQVSPTPPSGLTASSREGGGPPSFSPWILALAIFAQSLNADMQMQWLAACTCVRVQRCVA